MEKMTSNKTRNAIAAHEWISTERESEMNNKIEGIISSLAALFVLFTAMLDPRLSCGLAIAFLMALSIYHFVQKT
jgi:hypothetical protein